MKFYYLVFELRYTEEVVRVAADDLSSPGYVEHHIAEGGNVFVTHDYEQAASLRDKMNTPSSWQIWEIDI